MSARYPYEEKSSRVYAIVRCGGRQEKASVDDVLTVDKLAGEVGSTVTLPALLIVDDGKVVIDSMEIVRYLEERFPDAPPLYPNDPARRADCLVFIDWFNRVWKRPPNEIAAELEKPEAEHDLKRVERLGRAMQGYLDLFEQMLTGREYLLGELSAADVAAFPFVKYATIHDPNDPHLFHKILVEYQKPGDSHPRVVGWIARLNRRPRV